MMKPRPSLHGLMYVVLPMMVSVTLLASEAAAEGIPLTSGVPATGSLGDLEYSNYFIDVSSEATRLTITLEGDGGDLDLFVRYGQAFHVEYIDEFMEQADFWAFEEGSNEAIEVSLETDPPISEGTWYIAPFNFLENVETPFTLMATVEEGATPNGTELPSPSGANVYDMYGPLSAPVVSVKPMEARPMGVGPTANGETVLNIQVQLAKSAAPIDVYFGLYLPALSPSEIFLLGSSGSLFPFSTVGVVPWAENVSDLFSQTPFGSFSTAGLPPGRYFLYLMVTPAGDQGSLYLWSTYFDVAGPLPSANTEPYLDVVVDDVVIDFGRLDAKRRNLGVGTALGAIPAHPYPVPPYSAPSGPIPNLCTYVNANTYLKTLPQIPGGPHIDPDQYPGGMTCVYAIVADADGGPINVRHVLPEPLFGRGSVYTAIPIPGGVPAGTLIDSYETMDAYNALLTQYANSGLLSVQPHVRSAGAPPALTPFIAPVEPLRTPPQEFPYVIGFTGGGGPTGIQIAPGQTVTESANPQDPLGLIPQGTVFKVVLKDGAWADGTARGYLWMIPVTDDFWDPRHSNNTGDPGLFVNNDRVGTVSHVGQTIPVIWEAPDDPDVEQTTHDRRHVDPETIPLGGTVNLEATVRDDSSALLQEFGLAAFPENDDGVVVIGPSSGTYTCTVEWDHFVIVVDQVAMHFDAESRDLNAEIMFDFAKGEISGAFNGSLQTKYVQLWHQNYLQPFACEGTYSGSITGGVIEKYTNDKGEEHSRFKGEAQIHLSLTGGRTIKEWDNTKNEYVTRYVEGTEDVDVVGSIRGSTENGWFWITWLRVIDGTMPQGFYLKWSDLTF